MTQQTYNGWPNYETWNVMLWMDNDEGLYRYYRRMVEQISPFRAENAKNTCLDSLGHQTPDGVNLESSKIRWGKIAEAMREK